jgi:hypothetical protein
MKAKDNNKHRTHIIDKRKSLQMWTPNTALFSLKKYYWSSLSPSEVYKTLNRLENIPQLGNKIKIQKY